MKLIRTFVVVAATSIWADARTVEAPRQDAAAPFQGKLVLFGAGRVPAESGVAEILVMNPDGTDVTSLLTIRDCQFMTGRISPDGRRLAFGVLRGTEGDWAWETWIWEDGRCRKLDVNAAVHAWSPDGRSLLCSRSRDDESRQSLLVEIATGAARFLPLANEEDVVEDWSPDGSRISVMDGNIEETLEHPDKWICPLRQIDLMDADGSARRRITVGPVRDNIWSRFSPDGSRIAHHQRWIDIEAGKTFAAYVVRDRDGGHAREFLRVSRLDEELREVDPKQDAPRRWTAHGTPGWSPDGSQLVVCLNDEGSARKRSRALKFALVFATPEGKITNRIDLERLGVGFVCELDWK